MDNRSLKIEIKAVKADEVSFVNRLEPGETIQLGFRYTYNIIYSGGTGGRAEMTLIAESKAAPEKFTLKVVESGFFTCPKRCILRRSERFSRMPRRWRQW